MPFKKTKKVQFKLTKEFIEEIKVLVSNGDGEQILSALENVHEADIAEMFDVLAMDEAQFIYRLLDEEMASEVLVELEEDVREKFMEALSAKEIAEQIDNMDSDDAADIIAEIPEGKQERVIEHLEDPEQAEDIVQLMQYGENSAGAIMGTELISVNENWTTNQCVAEMQKQAQDVQYVYTIYVVNDKNELTGMLSLKSLLFATENTKVKDVYMKNVRSVHVNESQEEVASMMKKYDLVAIPVIDFNDNLIGRITIDDVVDIMQEESEKDYQMASGISENIESSDSAWRISQARIPWLMIGLLGGVLGAKVIGLFEEQLAEIPAMAMFIPLIAAMGGNVGVQSSAIIVQSLANNSLDLGTTFSKLMKELLVSLINGVVLSILIFLFIFLFEGDLKLAITVSLSLITVIIFAGLFGTFVPLALDKRKIDPALATGPFITTMNDVFGLLIYFLIGYWVYF